MSFKLTPSTVGPSANMDFKKFGTSVVTLAFIPAMLAVIRVWLEYPIYRASVRLSVSVFFLSAIVILLNLFAWSKFESTARSAVNGMASFFYKKRFLSLLLSLFVADLFFYLALQGGVFQPILEKVSIRLFLFLLLSFFIGWIIGMGFGISNWNAFSLSILILAMIWQILVLFPRPLDYPFSLSWSETSWYYYSSFFFDRKLYGMDIPWPFLDIGRPLLLSPAYLLPKPSLVVMRLWEFFLWIGTACLVSWSLWRRLKIKRGITSVLFILWGVLWVLLGPIYIHLSLVVAIVLLGFDRTNLFKSLFWISIASILGGVFRINWIPVPAMLGLTLYFLETPMPDGKSTGYYLKRSFWVGLVGLVVGMTSFIAYLNVSGRIDTRIGSKFSADFLWYRLLPNATLSTGIILGAILVSTGLLIAIYFSSRELKIAFLRRSLLTIMMLILFAGGSFASTKIGGGNNLHNLDAYLAMLMIWGSYALTGTILAEQRGYKYIPPQWLIVLVFITTAGWELMSTPVTKPRDTQLANSELIQLAALITETSQSGQDVLFIQNRHLITFGLISDVPLVTDFELEEIAEIAISNNTEGAEQFRNALREKRYGLIVMGIESGQLQGLTKPFAAENNAWKETVLFRVQAQYESILTLPEGGVQVYAPKP